MTSWWQERTPREQLVLKGLAVLAVLLMAFQLVYAPIRSFRAGSIAAYRDAATLLAEMQEGAARAATAATIGEAVPADERSVRIVATEIAREMGLTIARLSPAENEGLNVWLDSIEGPLLFGWLLRLRDEHGVHVRRAAIHKSEGANLVAEFTLGRS